jgi:hypothetical protein
MHSLAAKSTFFPLSGTNDDEAETRVTCATFFPAATAPGTDAGHNWPHGRRAQRGPSPI